MVAVVPVCRPERAELWIDADQIAGADDGGRTCGVWVIDIRDGRTVAFLRFEGTVQEIFAVQVLPGILYPDIVNEPGESRDSSFVLPDEALLEVPTHLRSAAV